MKPEIKKLLILNAPYLLFVYLFDKVGQAVRLAPGTDMSAKLLSIGDGFSAAFSNAFPSVHPADLLIGIAGAVIVRLAVYIKGKNAKKYRKGIEYGSARWGKAEDIKPYIDLPTVVRIILIVGAVLVAVAGIAAGAMLDIKAGYFECPHCKEFFVPSMNEYVKSYHTFTKRRLTCPKCGKTGMCKHRVTR